MHSSKYTFSFSFFTRLLLSIYSLSKILNSPICKLSCVSSLRWRVTFHNFRFFLQMFIFSDSSDSYIFICSDFSDFQFPFFQMFVFSFFSYFPISIFSDFQDVRFFIDLFSHRTGEPISATLCFWILMKNNARKKGRRRTTGRGGGRIDGRS